MDTTLSSTTQNNKIQLSVITLSFHRAESLLKKLKALQNCDLDKRLFEIIIGFNDGDKQLQEKIETLELSYQTTYLMFPENIGISKGRNACIEAAQGDIIYFSDDDCIPESKALRLHLEAQTAKQAVYIAPILFLDDNSKTSWQPKKVDYGNTNGANTSIPKTTIQTIGGFDENLSGYGGEDILLGYKLKELSLEFIALADAWTTHLGPDPALSKNTDKAYSAGHNAVIIANKLPPSVAFRLGIHPLLLKAKQAVFNPITMSLFSNSATLLYEKAYLDGALAARKKLNAKPKKY